MTMDNRVKELNNSKNDSDFFQSITKLWNIGDKNRNSIPPSSNSSKPLSKEEQAIQTYNTTNQENIWRRVPRKIRPVLKLCYGSLCYVFTEFDNKQSKKDASLVYNRMANIPVNAAFIFWLELLDIQKENEQLSLSQRSFSSIRTSINSSILEESSRTSFNKSIELPSTTSNIPCTFNSHFENQLCNSDITSLDQEDNIFAKTSYWEYFITKDERDEFIKMARREGNIAKYIRDKLVSIGLLRIVEISSELPYNLQTLLMNSNHDGSNGHHHSSNFMDDSQSIATNMNAYEDILYDNDWPEDQTISSATTTFSDDKLRPKKSTSERELITTYSIQHFQICTDVLYEYGYYFLLSRNKKDGGIWIDDTKESLSLFDKIISKASIRLRRQINYYTQQKNYLKKNSLSFNDNHLNEMKEEDYYWISLLSTSPERLVNDILQNGSMLYALCMLPTHLLKCNLIDEAVSFLSSNAFLYARIILLGVEPTTHLVKKDCQQLLLYDSKGIDEVYNAMRHCLISEFPILNGGEGVIGETYAGEIGKMLHVLAVSLERMGGMRKKALQFYIDALRYKKATLGDFDLSVAHTFRSIGKIYFAQSLYQEGILLFGDSLIIERQVLGKNHQRVAETMSNMALAYSMTAEYDLAISFYNQVLDIESTLYGDDCLQVAETQKCLGRLNMIMKNYDSAISYLTNSLDIYKQVYDNENLCIADIYHHLGIIYDEIQQYNDAITYFKKSHEIKDKYKKDDTNESIARSLHHMAKTYTKIGDVDNAITCYEKVLRIRKATFGYDHGEIARTLFDFAHTMQVAAQYEMALDALNETLRILRLITDNGNVAEVTSALSNNESSEIADVLHRIGIVFREKGDTKQALDHFRSTLDIRRKKFGNNHNDVADVLLDMGHTYFQSKAYDDAQQCYDQARDICSQQDGRNRNDDTQHVANVSKALNSIGILQLELGNADKAMEYFCQALRELHSKQELYPISEQIAESFVNLAHAHKQKMKTRNNENNNKYHFQQALKNYQEALELRKSKLGSNHLIVAETMYYIGVLHTEMEDEGSLAWFKQAMAIYKEKGFHLEDGASFNGMNQNFVKLCQYMSKMNGRKKQVCQYALSC